ncbi:cilia- and flagella-associated protein 299-like [Bombus vancouverensis nearcticus]|uniref:Cilia- and flagella-associated protein 299 n=1 Tax=Bombus bifarius TaxID=103933 RepID=A0A6P8M955_9HYME|nr:cilia- and flagella-associated protein 299-like [Bombus vancouverensis nearcticus]XP_033304608.1 cilia- and flagella-associated protein 299-like [Bombus bifarius]
MTAVGTQIDSDKRLIQFETYEDYLDSLVTFVDLGYLGNLNVARRLAELGYRCTSETLDEETFYRRLEAVKNLLFPIYRPYELTSEQVTPRDNIMQELALRERLNRLKIISTIIFVRNLTKLQFEISGYIDFSERLEKENWLPYFQGRKKIWPCASDLAYYYWRTGKTCLNKTSNFQPVIDPILGLRFKHCHDRHFINVDPGVPSPGIYTTRVRIHSQEYEHIILYDHVLRTRC